MSLANIDRRILFLLIFIGVAIPLIKPLGLKIEVSPNTKMVYDMVEETPAGSTVLFSFDYDPGSRPELHPMAKAALYHAFRKDLNVVCTALWPMGVQMYEELFLDMKKEFPDLKYGEDYVSLGYKAGGIVTIQSMGKNIKDVFPTDLKGTLVNQIPIMKDFSRLSDAEFILSFSAGVPGIKEWVMVAHDKFGVNVSGGATAVTTPSMLPYVNEQKQLHGLLGGMAAAAQYETLVNRPGKATGGMDAQSIAHLIIIIFILIGNYNFIRAKKNEEKK